jgi:hypothetical protein
MAERPIFVPAPDSPLLVDEIFLPMKWHPGFAPIQKEKNIIELHNAAAAAGYQNVLEVSTKSQNKRGQHLSAFYLKVKNERIGEIFLECAFQGSKVFELGGPFTDIYGKDVWEAKKDPRLKESGRLTGFRFDGFDFPLEPKTAFYDWLYINCLYPHREWATKLYAYGGFSDIEFNPHRSINCQARSIALFLSLMKLNLLESATKSPSDFINLLLGFDYRPSLLQTENEAHPELFHATKY